MRNPLFHQLLRQRHDATGRRMNVKLLAAQIGAGRCHLVQVLNGSPDRGHYTRRKLYAALTADEIQALGWPEKPFHIEQSSNSTTTNQKP